MSKLLILILSIILTVAVFSVPTVQIWIGNLYDGITLLNSGFFAKMPAWFNFLFATLMFALLIAFARSFRK